MGILNFNKSIKSKYPNAFRTSWLQTYDHIYIDLNFALHYSSYGTVKKTEIYSRLFKFIENIILELIPTKSIVFACDGSAPLSKLVLQRKRRLNMSRGIEISNITIDPNVDASSLLFTPGTDFMMSLEDKMNDFMLYLKLVFNVDVEFMDHEYDEAELKLKKKIMDNISNNSKDTHAFVSNDADVVLMLTTLANFDNVYIFNKGNSEVLSILKLIDEHTDLVGTTLNPGLDFTALNLLLGNDYLPKINYVDFDKLWNAYQKIAQYNIEGLVIYNNNKPELNISFLRKIMIDVLHNIKSCYINNTPVHNLFSYLYKNYANGYNWCMLTYTTGICDKYDYMYECEDSPHPLGILYNLEYFTDTTFVESKPLSPVLYSILLLPKSWKHLINEKYHNFVECEKNLYMEESCNKCKQHNKKLREFKSQIKILESEKKSVTDVKKQLRSVTKDLSLHKKQHTLLTLDDIYDIKTKFDKIY